MFAPGVPDVMKDFDSSSDTLATFVVSIYLIGFAFGPLIIAPLSEIYGRYWVYMGGNIGFIIFAIACAVSKNLGQLIAFRFLHGVAGVAPLTIGGGTIADMMPVEKRGGAMALYALGPLLGPVIGPVAGAYLSEAKGWRWTFWLLAMLSGVMTIATFVLSCETYHPTLLEKKAKQLRKKTGNPALRSKLASNLTSKQRFTQAIIRPTKMLLFSPIITAVCAYTGVAYGILYLLFTTFSFVFTEAYHFSTGATGLVFIPLGIGMLLSLAVMGVATDRIIKGKQSRGETVKPEDRLPLPLVVGGAFCLPLGLFIYGWTVQYKIHWIVPLIGTVFDGIGLLIIFVCDTQTWCISANKPQMAMQTYLVDAFVQYAASALAANTVLRSLMGGLLPLCGLSLYSKLGYGWGNSLLAFISLALVPIPALFSLYGERIRNRFPIEL
jgi:multidrug resistance protein